MTAAVVLYGLGAVQAAALVGLLLRVESQRPALRRKRLLVVVGALLWFVFAAIALVLVLGWLALYPWRKGGR